MACAKVKYSGSRAQFSDRQHCRNSTHMLGNVSRILDSNRIWGIEQLFDLDGVQFARRLIEVAPRNFSVKRNLLLKVLIRKW